jgi:hypothetical protein
MLDQPGRTQNTPQFSPQSEPPRQGAIARFFGIAKMLAGYSFFLMFLLMVAERELPPEFKPSTQIGTLGGKIETAEIAAKKAAAVEYARQQAEAAAKAQADAQKKAEILANSESVNSFFTQLGDLACIAGQFVPRNAPDSDTRTTGEALRSGCGLSAKLREKMAHDLDAPGN